MSISVCIGKIIFDNSILVFRIGTAATHIIIGIDTRNICNALGFHANEFHGAVGNNLICDIVISRIVHFHAEAILA